MNPDELRALLRREPFDPFRITLTSGDVHVIVDPYAVAVMKNRLFIALPDGRWLFIPYLHIAAIETLSPA